MSDYWRIVLAVSVGGMLGGLLYWTADYLRTVRPEMAGEAKAAAEAKAIAEGPGAPVIPATKPEDEAASAKFPWSLWFCAANAFTGAGGAWAAALAMLWAKRMPVNKVPLEDQLLLLGTSIIAGYAGNRLLPAVAERLTRELLERKAEEAKVAAAVAVKAGKTTMLDAKSAARSELTSEVYAYLDVKGSQSTHQTLKYVENLRAELKLNPLNRKAAVLLARLFDELLGKRADSIEVLEAFVKDKTAGGQKGDVDVADSSWNLANYYEEAFAETKDRKWRLAAIEAVERAIVIVPGYLKNAQIDPDFESFRNDAEVQKRLPALKG